MSFFSGVTKFDSAARLGNTSTLLFQGGTILPTASWNNAVPVVLSDYTAINAPALTTATFIGGVTLDSAPLNDALIKNGMGTLNLQGNSTARFILNSGTLRIDSGTVRYTGSAPALSTKAGGFYSDASSLAAGNLPTGGGIAMAGGRVGLTGPENLGTLSLAANTFNNFAITGTATFSGVSQQSGAAIVYGDFGTLGSTNFVRFTNAPSGSLLLGGGGAAGTASISILAGSLVEDVGTTGFTDNFATYDAANGVRALGPSEYATTISSGATDLNNASISTAIAIAAPTTINSLSCKNAGAVSGNTTLTVNSGLLLNANVSVATLSFPQPAVIYGGSISSVISGTSVLIAGSTSFSGANSYTGPTVIASGTLSDSASEVIPDTSLVYVNANALNGPTAWNINGFTESVAGISQQNVVNSGASFGIIQLGTGTLIVGSGNVSSSFAGNIGGSGHLVKIGTGTLSLSGKSNTFSSGLIIRQGILTAEAMPVASSPTGNPSDFAGMVRDTVSGDSVLGSGSIFLMSAPGNSAELRLGRGVTDLSRPIFVGTGNGAGTCVLSTDIDPNHGTPTAANPNITSPITITNSSLQLSLSSGTLSGLISGSGSIVVNSNPVSGEDPQPIVTISNAVNNTYTGTTSVINGSLYVNPAAGIGTPLGNTTSAINLGSSATTGYAELSLATDGGSFSRAIIVTPGQPGSTLALTGRPRGVNNSNLFSGNITLGATPLRVFAAPNPAFGGSAGTVLFASNFSGAGSLTVGGGVSTSTVWLESSSSTYTGGTTLTDGTLALGGNSTPTIGTPTSGPIGTGSLIVSGGALPPTLIGLANGVTVANPLMLNGDVVFAGSGLTFTNSTTYVGERTVTVNSFNVTLSGPVAGNGFLDKDGTGTLVISSSNTFTQGVSVFAGSLQFGASETMPVLNVGGTAKAIVNTGGDKVLRTNALNIATGGVLDLTDEDAILEYTGTSPLPRIAQLIARGYNSGSWSGTGITSSRAQAIANSAGIPHKTAIGFAEASTLGINMFDGQSVDASAILLRYTFMGDANLDGLVNALDFNAVASNFGGSNRTWAGGDFTFDNQVNTLDFNWIATNFNQPPLPSAALGSLIPEPYCLTLPLILLLARRRRFS
jgi:autotransporter-associated beta strand protein